MNENGSDKLGNDDIQDLDWFKSELEKRDKEIGEMITTFSKVMLFGSALHDAHNMLSSLAADISVLIDKMPKDKKSSLFIEHLTKKFENLRLLHEKMWRFLKIDTKKNVELKALKKCLRELSILYEERLSRKSIQLKVHWSGEAGTTQIPNNEFVLIFSNLLNNAIDAFDKLSKKQNIISINCLVKGTKLHLTFFDNGPGIAKEYIEKIWEPFFTDNKDGFGLGLTAVKRLVADLDGSIFVKSQLGKHSTFQIIIPQNISGKFS